MPKTFFGTPDVPLCRLFSSLLSHAPTPAFSHINACWEPQQRQTQAAVRYLISQERLERNICECVPVMMEQADGDESERVIFYCSTKHNNQGPFTQMEWAITRPFWVSKGVDWIIFYEHCPPCPGAESTNGLLMRPLAGLLCRVIILPPFRVN